MIGIFKSIEKTYSLNQAYEEVFSKFETIISEPFNNSRFRTFGSFISTDPPEFLLINKGISIGKPMFPEIASTRASIKIINDNKKVRVQLTTHNNPSILVLFFVLIVIGVLNIFLNKNIIAIEIYFGIAALCLLFDRFIKNILIANVESDMNLKSIKKVE